MDENMQPEAPASEKQEEEKRKLRRRQHALSELYDWIEIFAISVSVVFVIFAFVARVAVVDGSSMNNTLKHGDKLLIKELFYTPKQGDIVVCQAELFGYDEPLVKRVIATEGQTIKIDFQNWKVYVDGVELEEDYVLRIAGRDMNGWSYGEEYTVPEGHVFVMGDNRNGSWDSRDAAVGPIDVRYVVGKVIFRFAPFSSFGIVK